jgi:hypothetical protein
MMHSPCAFIHTGLVERGREVSHVDADIHVSAFVRLGKRVAARMRRSKRNYGIYTSV